MDADRKVTALKHLQGLIWRAGYLNGHIIGHNARVCLEAHAADVCPAALWVA